MRRAGMAARQVLWWLGRYWLWSVLAVAVVLAAPLAVWLVGRGEQWYQSLDAVVALCGLLLTIVSAVGAIWRGSADEAENPFEQCTTAGAVRQSLLYPDEVGSLGMRLEYFPRASSRIDAALRRAATAKKRSVLVLGSDCSGKTRELLEVGNRHLLGGAVALVYASDEVPRHIRLDVRRWKRRVFLLIDDIHDLCRQGRLSTGMRFVDELRNAVQKQLRRRMRKDVSVIASCAFYSSAIEDIRLGKHDFWEDFEVVSLSFLSRQEMEKIVDRLATEASLSLSDSQRAFILESNTGVFVPVLELFNRAANSSRLQNADLAWYASRLQDYWDATRNRLVQEIPGSDAIFKAVDILQQLEIELFEELVFDTALAISKDPEDRVHQALEQLKRFGLPPSEEDGRICVFRGQTESGYVPETEEEFRAVAGALAKHRMELGAERLFDIALQLASSYGEISPAIDLWYCVLDSPFLGPAAQFNIGMAIGEGEDEVESVVHFAEAITAWPELAAPLILDTGYVERSALKLLWKMSRGSVSSHVAEAVSRLCDRFVKSGQVSEAHEELLLRLSLSSTLLCEMDCSLAKITHQMYH